MKRCETCQDHRKQPPSAPLHPWEYQDGPWKHVHIDYAGPIDGHMLLIVVDANSKWIETYMTRSITSLTIANKLRECFAQHGMPDIVVSDNATYFVSEEFSTFLSRYGSQHVQVAPHHPSSNGLAKRALQTMKEGIKKKKETCIDSCYSTGSHRSQLREAAQSSC